MNKIQFNIITQLNSTLSTILDKSIKDLTKGFDDAINKIVEASDKPN